MFSELYNEAVIEFDMHTESPLFINSGNEDQLNPASADHTFFVTYRNGIPVPTIPGSSLKGVFRSEAERLLRDQGACDILRCPCSKRINDKQSNDEKKAKKDKEHTENMSLGEIRYKESCPVCKIFGSQVLKSRITFNDSYPKGDVKTGRRASVAIDRISGASKGGALFDFEYIEDAVFRCRIYLRNFFRWHIKLLFAIFDRIDEGYVTFGGFTSKGFGKMKIDNVNITVRYYDKKSKIEGYTDTGFYMEKKIEGRDNISELLKNVEINERTIEGCDLRDDKAL